MFFFFLEECDFFFQNWEKSHPNSIGNGTQFQSLRTQKKSLLDEMLPLSTNIMIFYSGKENNVLVKKWILF